MSHTINTTTPPATASKYLDDHDGHLVGCDPRDMPIEQLAALGFTSPIRAIRAKCLDCCGGSPSEVRKCVASNCPLWAFRMGANLFRGKGIRVASAAENPRESHRFQTETNRLIDGRSSDRGDDDAGIGDRAA